MVDPAVARHFAESAKNYSRFRGRGPLGRIRAEEQRAVEGLVEIETDQRVLDAGCGDGETLKWLAASGARAVGIDLSWPMARLCSAAGHPVSVQDIEHLGLEPVFDWVLCIGAMEFVASPERAVSHLAGCLAPGGKLVLLYPRRGMLGWLYTLYHRSHGARIHTFDRPRITKLMTGAGLAAPSIWRDCTLASVCKTQHDPVGQP